MGTSDKVVEAQLRANLVGLQLGFQMYDGLFNLVDPAPSSLDYLVLKE